MASYGYGYGHYTSQTQQQYPGGTYANQNAGSYGYASTQPTRVIQGYQQAGTAYGTTGYAGAPAPAPIPAATSGGYGYFQRASDQNTAYVTTQKTSNYPTSQAQAYGYATSGVKAAYSAPSAYAQKPQQAFAAPTAASSTFAGYTVQRPVSTPSYNNTPAYQKPKPANTAVQKTSTAPHQNAYEKVVYNAATSFLTQQAQTSKPAWQKNEKPTFKLQNQKSSWPSRSSGPPKPQQLHYCEVCKISCAGPQTYKEHLEGQKHKKKAASATSDTKHLPPGTYKCELCEVVCTGKDAFNAHIKGANHMKTLKLHQKLGKPIPDIKTPADNTPAAKKNVVKTTAPKINFVGGAKLSLTGTDERIETEEEFQSEVPVEGEPIGEEYVEDIKSDVGKVIGFKCVLCDCRFNDVVAKTAHIKGRRHRLTYKKKVDPKLKVDVKSSRSASGRQGRLSLDDKSRNPRQQEMVWKQRQQEQMRWEQELRVREEELRRWEHEEFMRRASEDRYWTRPDRHRMHELEYYEWERRERYLDPQVGMYGPHQGPPPPSADDKLIMIKHGEIYPTETELKQVQTTVASVEKALKLVSDSIGESDKMEEVENKKVSLLDIKVEKPDPPPLLNTGTSSQPARVLKGVMRVGVLAKGLLLQGQLSVELVVLCAEKPTYTLLKKVGKLVPEKLKEAAPEEKYNMSISVAECAVVVSSTSEPKCTVKVVLTSPIMRDDEEEGKKSEDGKVEVKKEPVVVDPKDVLDKDKALQALAALRHAKWFQARANHLTSCVVSIRILRDLCKRVPAFKPLSGWAVELLCEKALASSYQPLGPGEAFRRILEAIACGIFLPGGPGLHDPCEKEKTDAVGNMTIQEREDITAAAQHALRLYAFRQIHKILGVEPLKASPKNLKRQLSNGGVEDTEESDSKVTKKSE